MTLEERMSKLEHKMTGLVELMAEFVTKKARELNSPSSSGECHGKGGHCSAETSGSCHGTPSRRTGHC